MAKTNRGAQKNRMESPEGRSLDYAEIRRRIPIRQVLTCIDYRPTVTSGPKWRGRCPLKDHSSSADSHRCFSVHLAKNVFQCFACGVGGNQLDLWAAIINRPLHIATRDLCRRLDLAPVLKARTLSKSTKPATRKSTP